MELMQQTGDDQLALLGCAGALLVAFTIMAVSHHVGRMVRGDSRKFVAPQVRTQPQGATMVQQQRRAA
jgi:arginine utilization protein RocB